MDAKTQAELLERQFSAAPEPVAHPSVRWQEEYADWYEETAVHVRALASAALRGDAGGGA